MVKVKALEWVPARDRNLEYWNAKTRLHPDIEYDVYAQGEGVYRADFDGSRIESLLPTSDNAKAVAQAHFEALILSALEEE